MRPEKLSIKEEVKKQIGASDFVMLVNYRGLSVQQMTEIRTRLAEQGARLQVVANSLLRHASKELGWQDEFSKLIDGPTAVVSGGRDASEVAKLIDAFYRDIKLPVPVGARLGNATLTATDVRELASLPSRPELLSKAVGTIAAPMSQLVGVMTQKLLSVLYVLKAVEQKKGGGN